MVAETRKRKVWWRAQMIRGKQLMVKGFVHEQKYFPGIMLRQCA